MSFSSKTTIPNTPVEKPRNGLKTAILRSWSGQLNLQTSICQGQIRPCRVYIHFASYCTNDKSYIRYSPFYSEHSILAYAPRAASCLVVTSHEPRRPPSGTSVRITLVSLYSNSRIFTSPVTTLSAPIPPPTSADTRQDPRLR